MGNINDCSANLLITLAKSGDSEAFGVLYKKYFAPIYKYVYFHVRSKETAEDITQTVFLKSFKAIAEFHDRGNDPAQYFYKIARNSVIDFWKKKKDYLLEDLPGAGNDITDSSKNPMEIADEKDAAHRILSSLDNLSEDQREIIMLKYISGLSTKEISEFTGKKADAVRQLQCRALRSLRGIIKSQYDNK